MAIEGFSPSPSPPYYQLLERGFARLGRVRMLKDIPDLLLRVNIMNKCHIQIFLLASLLCFFFKK